MQTTIIYDGTCGICARQLKWLRRLDWGNRFEALPYQKESVYARFPQLRREECEQAVHLVAPDGRVCAGAAAFREIFLRLPLLWPLGVLMSLPPVMGLARRCYHHIAAHRYEWSGSRKRKEK